MKNLTIAGRIGSDAVSRTTKGDNVTNFSVAVDRFRKDDGPLWIKVSLWGTRGEKLEQYLTKGKVVSVSGEMDLKTYHSTKNDEDVTEVVLNANQVTLLGGGSEREESTDDSAEDDSDESRAGF